MIFIYHKELYKTAIENKIYIFFCNTCVFVTALDAYCLLEVYGVFRDCCLKQNIPFYEICTEVIVSCGKKPVKTKPSKQSVRT